MGIVYKKMSENELSRIIKMRIDQLTEEYTSEGKTVPQDVNLEASLMDCSVPSEHENRVIAMINAHK